MFLILTYLLYQVGLTSSHLLGYFIFIFIFFILIPAIIPPYLIYTNHSLSRSKYQFSSYFRSLVFLKEKHILLFFISVLCIKFQSYLVFILFIYFFSILRVLEASHPVPYEDIRLEHQNTDSRNFTTNSRAQSRLRNQASRTPRQEFQSACCSKDHAFSYFYSILPLHVFSFVT
jgi:hypothetical protein